MPGIRLEITVDDKGSPVVRQFNQTVGKTTEATGQAGGGFASAAKQALLFGAGLSGVGALASTAGAAFAGATRAVAGFELGMAQVSTLIRGDSTAAVGKLQAQLLGLSPALGESTELTRGLYAALSGGINAADAIGFVTVAAKAARAGLTELGTSTDTLAGILQAYNLQAGEAGRISDILFQTVNVGRGTFDAFSRAVSTVAPLAKTLGVSLEEVGATLGTLSFAFPSAAEAGQGLRSALTNLIQNAGKFAAIGIDVQKVIAEEGLTGLFNKLNIATQGNTTAIRELIPDVQGLQAVLAVTGAQAERHAQNLATITAAAGSTEEAFKKITATASESFGALLNNLGRFASVTLGPLLGGLTGLANLLSGGLTVGTIAVQGAFEGFGKAASFITGLLPSFTSASVEQKKAIDASAQSLAEMNKFLDRHIAEQERAANAGVDAAKAIENAYLGLGQQTPAQLKLLADSALENFLKIEATGKEPPERIRALWDVALKDIKAFYTTLPDTVKDVNARIPKPEFILETRPLLEQLEAAFKRFGDTAIFEQKRVADEGGKAFRLLLESGLATPAQIQNAWEKTREQLVKVYGELPVAYAQFDEQVRRQGSGTAQGIADAFAQLQIKTSMDLQLLARNALASFQEVLVSGQATPQQLLETWQRILKQITDAGFQTLPPGFQELANRMQGIANKLGVELPKPIIDAFGKINASGKAVADEIGKKFDEVFTALAKNGSTNIRELAANLTEAQVKAGVEFGLISRHAGEVALALKAAGTQGGQGLASGIKEGVDKSEMELDRLARAAEKAARDVERNRRIVTFEPFGDTPRQLLAQLAQFRSQASNAAQIAGRAGLGPDYAKYLRDVASDAIFLIGERLKALGFDISGRPLDGSDNAGRPLDGSDNAGRSGFPGGSGLSGTSVTSTPAGFGQGGSGDEVLSFSNGQPFRLPGTSLPGTQLPLSPLAGPVGGGGENTVVTRQTGTTINVVVNTAALTTGAAQDLANSLAPALRELQRRGQL